jgi:hypothetical protein
MPQPPSSRSSLPKLFRTDQLKATFGTVLGYGPAGGGKTFSIRTCPNPIILSTELGETAGFLSLGDVSLPALRVTNHDTLVAVVQELNKYPGRCSYEGLDFETVVLDSGTHMGEGWLDRFMQLKGWKELWDPSFSASGSGKDPRSAYAYVAEKGRQMYKILFSVHAHLYIICREGTTTVGDILYGGPQMPGQKLPLEMPGWPDATIRLRKKTGQYVMVTTEEDRCPARVRLPGNFPKLPRHVKPDVGALFRFMCGDQSAFNDLALPKEKKGGISDAEQVAHASAAH